jgi:PhoH-like ATPase
LNDLVINEYVAIKDCQGNYSSFKYRFDGEKLVKLKYEKISNAQIGDIEPKNVKQEMLFDLLQNDEIPIKLVTGTMGSGKTYIAVNYALHKIQHDKNKFKKIVYIRNNVEVKDTVALGALPNGIKDKLLPFILPIQDCLGGNPQQLEFLERSGAIEYVHLGHVRGRSFSNSVIIVSESNNLTRDHVKLLIGRVGENSIIIFEGDTSQTDKKVFETDSGIEALRYVLAGNPLFGAVDLDKSERSRVAELSNLF